MSVRVLHGDGRRIPGKSVPQLPESFYADLDQRSPRAVRGTILRSAPKQLEKYEVQGDVYVLDFRDHKKLRVGSSEPLSDPLIILTIPHTATFGGFLTVNQVVCEHWKSGSQNFYVGFRKKKKKPTLVKFIDTQTNTEMNFSNFQKAKPDWSHFGFPPGGRVVSGSQTGYGAGSSAYAQPPGRGVGVPHGQIGRGRGRGFGPGRGRGAWGGGQGQFGGQSPGVPGAGGVYTGRLPGSAPGGRAMLVRAMFGPQGLTMQGVTPGVPVPVPVKREMFAGVVMETSGGGRKKKKGFFAKVGAAAKAHQGGGMKMGMGIGGAKKAQRRAEEQQQQKAQLKAQYEAELKQAEMATVIANRPFAMNHYAAVSRGEPSPPIPAGVWGVFLPFDPSLQSLAYLVPKLKTDGQRPCDWLIGWDDQRGQKFYWNYGKHSCMYTGPKDIVYSRPDVLGPDPGPEFEHWICGQGGYIFPPGHEVHKKFNAERVKCWFDPCSRMKVYNYPTTAKAVAHSVARIVRSHRETDQRQGPEWNRPLSFGVDRGMIELSDARSNEAYRALQNGPDAMIPFAEVMKSCHGYFNYEFCPGFHVHGVPGYPQMGVDVCGRCWYDAELARRQAASAVYSGGGGAKPCFPAWAMIKMANGTVKRAEELKRGDRVATINGQSANVTCILRTTSLTGVIDLVHVPDTDLWITKGHPIRLDGVNWVLPKKIAPVQYVPTPCVYSPFLDHSHIIYVNGVECVTMGHNDPNLPQHYYFSTKKVVDDLMQSKGWENGIVDVIMDHCWHRDAKRRIIGIQEASEVVV